MVRGEALESAEKALAEEAERHRKQWQERVKDTLSSNLGVAYKFIREKNAEPSINAAIKGDGALVVKMEELVAEATR
eukprot:2897735-Alexandrium_andersonii.AAC.1